MKTLMGTPEIEWRRIYGVMWDAESNEPYTQYTDLNEAIAIASITGGYLVEKWFGITPWVPCVFEEET